VVEPGLLDLRRITGADRDPAAELAITQPREIGVYLRTFAELAAMAVYGSRARELINGAIADFR